jgi:hypothetical protein
LIAIADAVAVDAHDPLGEEEVAGGTDRQVFGQSLDNAEDRGLTDGHRRFSGRFRPRRFGGGGRREREAQPEAGTEEQEKKRADRRHARGKTLSDCGVRRWCPG